MIGIEIASGCMLVIEETTCLYRGVVRPKSGLAHRVVHGGWSTDYQAFAWAEKRAREEPEKGIQYWVEYDIKGLSIRVAGMGNIT